MRSVRDWASLAAVAFATLFSFYFSVYVATARVLARPDESIYWSAPYLLNTWGHDVLIAVAAALVLALLLPRGSGIWWYVGLGAALTLGRAFLHPPVTVWMYAAILMSIIGAVLGGGMVMGITRLRSPPNNRWRVP